MFLIATPSKSTGTAILFLLACIAITIFYIAVSNDDDGSVVGQDDNSSSNLRQLSLIDPKTIIGKSTDTNCNHVLVTSIGGVGSSKFVGQLVGHSRDGKKGSISANQVFGWDGFKHKPATWWKDHDASSIRHEVTPDFGEKYPDYYDGETSPCFNKALVIIGDPMHAIESTYRRFGTNHINLLKEGAGLGSYSRRGVQLTDIYNDIIKSGKDQTGFTHFIQSWYAASQDRSNWPEIQVVTAKVLYTNAADIARWLGVDDEEELAVFDGFNFDPKKRGTTIPQDVPADLREEVVKTFDGAFAIINKIEA